MRTAPSIRCFTCNKVIGHLWTAWDERVSTADFFETRNIARVCCRRMFVSDLESTDIDDVCNQKAVPSKYSASTLELEI